MQKEYNKEYIFLFIIYMQKEYNKEYIFLFIMYAKRI